MDDTSANVNEMSLVDDVTVGRSVGIRDAGYDEEWLKQKICNDPSILGLGEIELLGKERKQSSGGRIDLFFENPEDGTMFEVEAQLGGTDESHIIRTIEYWDNEKRKYPQRQHFAVLIAETITRRFFNVISLLSLNIPLIAIQVNILDIGGEKSSSFFKGFGYL